MKLKRTRRDRVLWVACAFAILGLALMVWSVLVPTPLPVLVALSAGQVVGTLSFAAYLFVVAVDLGIARRLKRQASLVPPPPTTDGSSVEPRSSEPPSSEPTPTPP